MGIIPWREGCGPPHPPCVPRRSALAPSRGSSPHPSSCLAGPAASKSPRLPPLQLQQRRAESPRGWGIQPSAREGGCSLPGESHVKRSSIVLRDQIIRLGFRGERTRRSPARKLAASSSSGFISPVPRQTLPMLTHQGLLSVLMALYK